MKSGEKGRIRFIKLHIFNMILYFMDSNGESIPIVVIAWYRYRTIIRYENKIRLSPILTSIFHLTKHLSQ